MIELRGWIERGQRGACDGTQKSEPKGCAGWKDLLGSMVTPNATNGMGRFTYMKGEKWLHEPGEMAG